MATAVEQGYYEQQFSSSVWVVEECCRDMLSTFLF